MEYLLVRKEIVLHMIIVQDKVYYCRPYVCRYNGVRTSEPVCAVYWVEHRWLLYLFIYLFYFLYIYWDHGAWYTYGKFIDCIFYKCYSGKQVTITHNIHIHTPFIHQHTARYDI